MTALDTVGQGLWAIRRSIIVENHLMVMFVIDPGKDILWLCLLLKVYCWDWGSSGSNSSSRMTTLKSFWIKVGR